MIVTFRRHNINVPFLLRVIGLLLLVEAVFLCIPLAVAFSYAEPDSKVFGVTTVLTFIAGILMIVGIRPRSSEMGKREGFLLTSLVWVVFSLFGMIPFIFGSPHLSVSDSFFESMSGFTTTGASILADSSSLSMSIHVWRSLMQWIGGMGIILFTLAVLPMLNSSGGMQMFNAEVTGITHDKLKPRVSQTAKRLWGIYTLLTLLLFVLLWIGPMDFFDALCHSLSTMSTGGFSTREANIAEWNSIYVKIVVTCFMFIGGVNFALIYRATSGHFRLTWHNEAFRYYIGVIVVIYFLFLLSRLFNGAPITVEALLIDPVFQIVSTISSTGYTLPGFETWGSFVLLLVLVMMFFGASAGSTSGGAKIDRAVYLVKSVRNEVYKVLHPNSMMPVSVNGRVVPPEIVSKVIAFLCLYGMIIVIGALILTFMEIPLLDSLFTSFSCISNAGLPAGITGYGSSFDIIPDGGKWVLALLMLIGRLELFTVVILFSPGFWRR